MELATLHLKLAGQVHNTVVKEKVTPAQLALYAVLHGEDCVQSLKVTGVDKNRSSRYELDRLRMEFPSEHAQKVLSTLFPGMVPQMPATFKSMGYDPEYAYEVGAPAPVQLEQLNPAAASIKDRIAAVRAATSEDPNANVAPVTTQDLTDALDNTGHGSNDDEDDEGGDNTVDLGLGDDPIDIAMRDQEQTQTTPPPAPAQE